MKTNNLVPNIVHDMAVKSRTSHLEDETLKIEGINPQVNLKKELGPELAQEVAYYELNIRQEDYQL